MHARIDRPSSPVSLAAALTALAAPALAGSSGPWAAHVAAYSPGSNPATGYTDPATVLGSPERFTGEAFGFPGVVSVFNPPFGPDEVVSLGEGGTLTVEFDRPLTDDPAHPFGADLILFGTGFFVDAGGGRAADPAEAFGLVDVQVSLSADGAAFSALPGTVRLGLFPTQGFQDGGPYDTAPGAVPTSFTRPMNPVLMLSNFDGRTFAEILALYAGSGGGTPIDLAAAGLSAARFVRVTLPDDGDPGTHRRAQIDAFAAVPEPGTLVLACLAAVAATRRGRGAAR